MLRVGSNVKVNLTEADLVANLLREAILKGELPPGDVLLQDPIASELGVSRIPVRDALRLLASEGLVTLRAHQRARVSALTHDQLEELYAIAAELDTLAGRRAASQITRQDLKEMEHRLHQMSRAETDPGRWQQLNNEFHQILTKAARWPHLEDMVRQSRGNISRYLVTPELLRTHVRAWHSQHEAIYRACCEGDSRNVEDSLRNHWNYSKEAISWQVMHAERDD